MPSKITYIFNVQTTPPAGAKPRTGGWSETFYSPSAPEGVSTTLINGIATRRAALLAASASIIAVRISATDGFRTSGSMVTALNFPGQVGNVTDVPQMAINVRLRAFNAINARSMLLRGVPDVQVQGGEYSPTAAYSTAVTTFLQYIVNQGICFKARDETQPRFELVTITAGGLATGQVSLAPLANSRVQFERVAVANRHKQGGFSFTGAEVGGSVTLFQWNAGPGVGGTLRLARVVFLPYASSTPDRPIKAAVKKVGRPFDLYRGRQVA